MIKAAMKAPIAMPGTNPAAKDLPLKSESEFFGSPSVGCTPSFAALDVEVDVPEEPVDVEVELGLD